jgi:hypothetical protein
MALLPPSPVGIPPGHSFWNDWYEKLREIINSIETTLDSMQNISEKDQPNGYAGLNADARVHTGVDTTDDVIVDDAGKGIVLKSDNGHYWRADISDLGTVSWVDLGTTKP